MVEPRTYVDVNVFVYWLGGHPSFGETARRWVRSIEAASPGRFLTSSLTVYEALVLIAGLAGRSLKDQAFVKGVVESIRGLKGLKMVPLTPADLLNAVRFMEEYKLDFEDAMHLAVALRAGAREIVTNDKDFDRTPLVRRFE